MSTLLGPGSQDIQTEVVQEGSISIGPASLEEDQILNPTILKADVGRLLGG